MPTTNDAQAGGSGGRRIFVALDHDWTRAGRGPRAHAALLRWRGQDGGDVFDDVVDL